MALIVKDYSLGIEVESANVRIAFYEVNRDGIFEDTGHPKFTANLHLEFSKNGVLYNRKCVTVSQVSEDRANFAGLYSKLKETDEFSGSKDDIPTYSESITIDESDTPSKTANPSDHV